MLELGIKAPDFELPDQNGEVHKLSDYLGKKIIRKDVPRQWRSYRSASFFVIFILIISYLPKIMN